MKKTYFYLKQAWWILTNHVSNSSQWLSEEKICNSQISNSMLKYYLVSPEDSMNWDEHVNIHTASITNSYKVYSKWSQWGSTKLAKSYKEAPSPWVNHCFKVSPGGHAKWHIKKPTYTCAKMLVVDLFKLFMNFYLHQGVWGLCSFYYCQSFESRISFSFKCLKVWGAPRHREAKWTGINGKADLVFHGLKNIRRRCWT